MSRSSPSSDRKVRTFDLSAVLIYPHTRDVAFASLGFLKVYEILRQRLLVADVSYLPTSRKDDILSGKKGILLGHRSRHEVKDFDIIAFSISYENDYLHLVQLVKTAGLPPLASQRKDTFPLVITGGFTMSINPLPIADFADVVVVGEAEPIIDSLLGVIEQSKTEGVLKPELLERLAEIDGLYVPALGERRVKRVWSPTEDIANDPGEEVSSHFRDMRLVEVGRGCARGCLFCAAGNLYRPVRMRDAEVILEHSSGSSRVGLVGTAVGDHPDIARVMNHLVATGCKLGISSLRVDQITPEVASLIARGGIRTIAVAPEAGSDVLRKRIRKGITRKQIFDAVTMLSIAGIPTIKLYFMIGLPGETDHDVEQIVALVADLADVRGRSKLIVAVGPFVPKPHTAFQWYPFATRETLRHRIRLLRQISHIKGCSVKVGSIEEARVEAILARGDRSLSRALLEAVERQKPLKSTLGHSEILHPHVQLDTQKPLPWDFIDTGIKRKRLAVEFRKSKAA